MAAVLADISSLQGDDQDSIDKGRLDRILGMLLFESVIWAMFL